MKKIVATICTVLALAGAGSVSAQTAAAPLDPAAVAAAHELFDSMNYRSMMAGAMQQMSQSLGSSMRAGAEAAIKNNPKMSEEQKQTALAKAEADLPAAIAKMQALVSDPTLVDEILAETVPLYARIYTADELKQIAAFYRTPVGAKMLAVMPKVMGEGMQIGQQIMLRRMGPMLQKMQQGGKP
jgi:hypothetical protein